MSDSRSEVLEGYVVDIACLRRYPRDELVERARKHTVECATMGHCLESGYGLVGADGGLVLLDTKATPLVFDALRRAARPGVRVRVSREMDDGEMKTKDVQLSG